MTDKTPTVTKPQDSPPPSPPEQPKPEHLAAKHYDQFKGICDGPDPYTDPNGEVRTKEWRIYYFANSVTADIARRGGGIKVITFSDGSTLQYDGVKLLDPTPANPALAY